MSKDTLYYKNEDITVVWKPKTCIHSTLCWKGMIEVFNPRVRPWIRLEGSATEKIIAQVRKCPSGALSYHWNNQQTNTESNIVSESANLLKIKVTPNGPLLINNECVIIHNDGREEIKTGTVALCRCGASANKPYCDGSHGKVGFNG